MQEKEPEDNKGQTPLHHAAECGNLEVCQLLIGESVRSCGYVTVVHFETVDM